MLSVSEQVRVNVTDVVVAYAALLLIVIVPVGGVVSGGASVENVKSPDVARLLAASWLLTLKWYVVHDKSPLTVTLWEVTMLLSMVVEEP